MARARRRSPTPDDVSRVAQGDVDALLALCGPEPEGTTPVDVEGTGRLSPRAAWLHVALCCAVGADRADLIPGLVLRGADPDATTTAGSLLYRAAANGRLGVVEALLAAGAAPNGPGGRTPIAAARLIGRKDIVKALLAAGGGPPPPRRRRPSAGA
jgi:hypothetical protein